MSGGRKKTKKSGEIKIIPNNMERYISFSWGRFRFVDSLSFLNASLDRLVKNTPKDSFHHLSSFSTLTHTNINGMDDSSSSSSDDSCTTNIHHDDTSADDLFELLTRKGVYPYEYVTRTAVFDETSLPPKDEFFSSLTESHISDDDYEHAQRIWSAFKWRNMGDYPDLYLNSDVNLLADVF